RSFGMSPERLYEALRCPRLAHSCQGRMRRLVRSWRKLTLHPGASVAQPSGKPLFPGRRGLASAIGNRLDFISLPPPALRECCHGGLACRGIAVGGCAAITPADFNALRADQPPLSGPGGMLV